MTDLRSPAVSVVIPVHNGERFIAEALASVFAQTYPPADVIVVDDGSTDGSQTVAQRYPVRLVRQENAGPGAARNSGIASASTDLIAFLDQDDLWMPGKLAAQVALLDRHPQLEIVLTHERFTADPGAALPARFPPAAFAEGVPGYDPSTLLARRGVFERVGLFDASLRITPDADWFFRVRDRGVEVGIVPEVLVIRRFHGANLSWEAEQSQRELRLIALRSIRRKRSAGSTDASADE
jgi:glycosyltransferase involved in cell wall biosynthesis